MFLDDDGYYWFLWPLFQELFEETGQFIDLYGNACFESENLARLGQILERAQILVNTQPETWSVSVGIQTHQSHSHEVFQQVSKTHFLKLLNQWQSLLRLAEQSGQGIVAFGD